MLVVSDGHRFSLKLCVFFHVLYLLRGRLRAHVWGFCGAGGLWGRRRRSQIETDMEKVSPGAKSTDLLEAFLEPGGIKFRTDFRSFLEDVFAAFCTLRGSFRGRFWSILGDPEPSGSSVFVWVKPQVATFGPTKSGFFFRTCFRRGPGERFYRLQVRFGYPFGHRFATFGNMLGLLFLMRILEGTRVSPRRVDSMSDAPSGGQVKPHLGTESSAKP